MLPMLMTRAGSLRPAAWSAALCAGWEAFSSSGVRSCVSVKTRCKLSVSNLVQAWSGCVSKPSPQAAPELLTRTCRPLGSRWAREAARALQASRDWRSAGRAMAEPPEPEDLPVDPIGVSHQCGE